MNVDAAIDYHARNNNIPVELVRSVIKEVSGFNALKINKDQYGLMQLTEKIAIASSYCRAGSNLLDPIDNLTIGCLWLRDIRDKTPKYPNYWTDMIDEAYPSHVNNIMEDFHSKCSYINDYKYFNSIDEY